MFGCIRKVYREATAHRMSMTKPPKFTGNLLNPSRYSIIPVDLVRYSIIGRLQNIGARVRGSPRTPRPGDVDFLGFFGGTFTLFSGFGGTWTLKSRVQLCT